MFNIFDSTEIFLTIDSTLGLESLSRNTKTLFISTRYNLSNLQTAKFGWPIKISNIGPFWTNIGDYNVYDDRIKYINNLSNNEWSNIKLDYSEFFAYDFENTKLKNLLNA